MALWQIDLLGRTAPKTTKHLEAYPSGLTVSPSVKIEKVIPRPTASLYDQGQTPRCVGYSISKVMNWFNKMAYDADWLYAQCKKIDGAPNEDGTNALAACQVLEKLGHLQETGGKDVAAGPLKKHGISGYRWATSVDQIRAVFATAKPQPVPIGINWYNAWFEPKENDHYEYTLTPISSAGGIAGGHEIGIWGCSDSRQAFALSNTWGAPPNYPSLVWLPYSTMTQLFAEGADAVVVTDLPTR